MPSNLERRLRALFKSTPRSGEAHRRAHEDEVLAAFARGQEQAPAVPRRRRRSRWLLIGGLGLAVVGACALPVEYAMSLGRGVEITMDFQAWDGVDPGELARRLGESVEARHIEVRVTLQKRTVTGPSGEARVEDQMSVQLLVFGTNVDQDAMWEDIQGRFPGLATAEIRDVPLAGTVQGTLGGKLSHRLLDLQIDREGVEAAEQQILAELIARGVEPEDASIDITQHEDELGNREIEVRVEAHGDAALTDL